jgi:hypothetical protein
LLDRGAHTKVPSAAGEEVQVVRAPPTLRHGIDELGGDEVHTPIIAAANNVTVGRAVL